MTYGSSTVSGIRGAGASLVRRAAQGSSWVIEGGPGTGKTLFALERTIETLRAGGSARLLVSSDLLATRLAGRVAEAVDASDVAGTWRTWLRREHAERGVAVPRIGSGGNAYDWAAIRANWSAWFSAPSARYASIVVDEAQAVPPAILRLARDASTSLFVFCDPYQRFESDGADLSRMVEALGVDEPWPVLVLEEDFRTTREIQRFAHALFAVDRPVPRLRPAPRHGPVPRVVTASADAAVARVEAEAIALASMDAVDKVAILATHATRAMLSRAARRANELLGAQVVETLAVSAVRGLEYDGVVLTAVSGRHEDSSSIGNDLDMYIGSTRAREALSFVHVPDATPEHVADRLASLERADAIERVAP